MRWSQGRGPLTSVYELLAPINQPMGEPPPIALSSVVPLPLPVPCSGTQSTIYQTHSPLISRILIVVVPDPTSGVKKEKPLVSKMDFLVDMRGVQTARVLLTDGIITLNYIFNFIAYPVKSN